MICIPSRRLAHAKAGNRAASIHRPSSRAWAGGLEGQIPTWGWACVSQRQPQLARVTRRRNSKGGVDGAGEP